MSKTEELLDVSEFAKSVGFRRYRIHVDPVLLTVLGSVYGFESGDLEVLRRVLIPLRIFMRIHRSALTFKFDIGPPNTDHLELPIPILVKLESGEHGDYFSIRIDDSKLAKQQVWDVDL